MKSRKYTEVKDTVLGLFLLLFIALMYALTIWLGLGSPATNSNDYQCIDRTTGQAVQCRSNP